MAGRGSRSPSPSPSSHTFAPLRSAPTPRCTPPALLERSLRASTTSSCRKRRQRGIPPQHRPLPAVAPSGRIDTIWNDTRNSGLANVSQLFYAYSWDGGSTWSVNVPASPPFDSSLGYPQQNKIGDYSTIVSNDTGADAVYTATYNG